MNWLVKILTFGWASAITLAPFGIYVKESVWDYQYTHPTFWKKLINHEEIHWAQQMEMLILFFYIWYFVEWLIKLVLPPYNSAYSALSFERESNSNEDNLDYLLTRKHYAWIKRIFK